MNECEPRNCDAPPSDNCVGYCARACPAIKIFSMVTFVEGAPLHGAATNAAAATTLRPATGVKPPKEILPIYIQVDIWAGICSNASLSARGVAFAVATSGQSVRNVKPTKWLLKTEINIIYARICIFPIFNTSGGHQAYSKTPANYDHTHLDACKVNSKSVFDTADEINSL